MHLDRCAYSKLDAPNGEGYATKSGHINLFNGDDNDEYRIIHQQQQQILSIIFTRADILRMHNNTYLFDEFYKTKK